MKRPPQNVERHDDAERLQDGNRHHDIKRYEDVQHRDSVQRPNSRDARNRWQCPKCKEPCLMRYSAIMSDTARRKTYQCQNLRCGHVFTAVEEVITTVVESKYKNRDQQVFDF